MVFLTQESDHALHLHKPGSGFASFLSQAVEDVAAVFLFSLLHPLPHIPPPPYLLHSGEHAAIFHISGYLHTQIFFSILIATPHHCYFLGWGKKTPIFSSVPHTFKNYLLEIVLDLAKRLDLSSLNARTNSMKFLAFVLYTMLEFDFCLSLSASLDFEIKSYLFSHFAFFPVPSTGPTTQEMHWKSLLNSTWYLMDKDLQFQVQADLQAISIILKTISIPLKQFSHRTNEIYFGDQ